ncbi:MAG: TonB-dependent receptor [Lentimicrobiaceae bacterium]|nr:TonB-dependent receptor [Lentimicrobiaceae bacterium]
MMIRKMRGVIFCAGIIFLSANSLQGQTQRGGGGSSTMMEQLQKQVTDKTGVIFCSVTDENDKSLEYATIAVMQLSDSSVITGGITNERGICVVDKIPWGTYLIRISYVGFKPLYIPDAAISKEKPIFTAPRQKINTESETLETVIIGGQREMIQTNLDKRVFNVDKNIATEGTTALELLENIPSVQVDLDGNVKLRGSSSVTILVDGRPTNLSMDEIPASMIASIELVTNPSARYEPDGVSGLINVVLKKEDKMGFNATATVGVGMSDNFMPPWIGNDGDEKVNFGKGNASLNFNLRYKKVNFFANYSFRAFNSLSKSTLERKNLYGTDADTSYLSQNTQRLWDGQPHNIRAGFDFYIDDNNTISIEGGYRFHHGNGNNSSYNLTTNMDNDTVSYYSQTTLSPPIGMNNWSASMNYTNNSKSVKNRTLSADLSFGTFDRSSETGMEQHYFFPREYDFFQNTYNTSRNYRVTGQVDFVTPLGVGGRLEAGWKTNWRSQQDDYTYLTGSNKVSLTENIDRANGSKYTEIINAAYLVYSNSLFSNKFKYQLGLRAELANTTSETTQGNTEMPPVPTHLFSAFPTIHLRYDFNDIHSLQLGYSRRVGRPNARQLNPYRNDADRLNLYEGNINLKPEFTESFDLGYLGIYQKMTISAGIFYKYKHDIITRYTVLINDSTTLTTYENINNSHSYGVEASLQRDLFKFWKLNVNASLYQTLINSNQLFDPQLSNDFSWLVRLNNIFTLPKDFQLQLNANYYSPTLTLNSMGGGGGGFVMFSGAGQGRMDAMWNIDLGARKSFFKKSLTVSLRVADIFNSRQSHVVSYGETKESATTKYSWYTADSKTKRDSRQIWLTVSYNISNYKQTPKKQQRQSSDDDYDDGGMMF